MEDRARFPDSHFVPDPDPTPTEDDFGLVGRSPAMERVRRAIREYGPTDMPVLVTGETGTGKELVATGLHAASRRAERPLVVVNCAALAQSIFESEFFGSARGSFTGADRDREGLVGAAEGGTLFLDEVGELPLDVQPKLLRLLEAGVYRGVGGAAERSADVRILAATNRDLQAEVNLGTFRADLYYRIAVLQIGVPALRSRSSDVRLLLQHFLEAGKAGNRLVAPEALQALEAWPWPGNVRELAHVVARTLVRHPSGPILGFELCRGERRADSAAAAPARLAASRHEFLHLQRDDILRTLHENRWNVSAAARALGWTRGALRSRMRRLGLEA